MNEPAEKNDSLPPAPRPRLVYTHAPVLLGVLLGREDDGWRLRAGANERVAVADPSVDPALLDEALEHGARVLLDASGELTIVGVVMTRRAIAIDRAGDVHAEVGRFVVSAREDLTLKTPGAYLRARKREVEVYGTRVVTRARDVAKILAAMIKLN